MFDEFEGLENIDDAHYSGDEDDSLAKNTCVKNPNRDDDRKLFQVRDVSFLWNTSIPYFEQPNRYHSLIYRYCLRAPLSISVSVA